MKTVGAFEGKTRFSALIDEASRGETIIITKNGKPVAQLGPVEREETFSEAMARVRARGMSLGMPIKEAIEKGRRY